MSGVGGTAALASDWMLSVGSDRGIAFCTLLGLDTSSLVMADTGSYDSHAEAEAGSKDELVVSKCTSSVACNGTEISPSLGAAAAV